MAADNDSMDSGLILLNSGGSGQDDGSGGRTWDGDTNSKFTPSVEGFATGASYQDPSLHSMVPYMTAHIFTSNYTYSFPVSPGRMFLRLHFYLIAYGNYVVPNAFFGVRTDNLVLLNGFNASQTAQTINCAYIVREFSLNVSSRSLDLTFSPSAFHNGSYAFMNGIEIVPMPDIFTTADTTFLHVRNYIAPLDVYGTAPSMGPNPQVNLNYNLTWILPVGAGFLYIVRFHFCEIQYPFTLENQRTFYIYINNQTACDAMDVISWSGGIGRPIYKDYAIVASGSGQVDMWIALHPYISSRSQYYVAILNGLEVFKLQGHGSNNLAELNPPLPQKSDVDPNRLSNGVRKYKGDILAAIGGDFALMSIALFSMCVICRRKKVAKSCCKTNYTYLNRPTCDLVHHFSIAEIQLATKDFDEALIIGRGGFVNVYIGKIDGGIKVAIKRLNQESQQGFHEFQAEIEMLCNFRHGHLVSLIVYYKDKNEMILVYDYMRHGTLREHLYGTKNPSLSWKQRLNICIGAARGLHYLHTRTEQGIIHRDVKTTNILLDDKLMAKVSDFGLSKACTDTDKPHVSNAVKGSFGYFDPEYFLLRRLTRKSDVYSFGVVLFEIMCARPVINTKLPDEQVSLRDWALSCQENGVLRQIVDPCIKEEITPECFRIFSELAKKCFADRSIHRPSMGDVLQNLEAALRLQDNCSRAGKPSSFQIISLVHSHKASTHSVISVSAQEEIFSDIVHPEGR
ncbi:receptor-like protein kinase FERONIA [Hordeum vulgare subsp. vulgare]|nr:receptor-like protein kinase FERONIA [Hordeum vulgare subsp. vulgare]